MYASVVLVGLRSLHHPSTRRDVAHVVNAQEYRYPRVPFARSFEQKYRISTPLPSWLAPKSIGRQYFCEPRLSILLSVFEHISLGTKSTWSYLEQCKKVLLAIGVETKERERNKERGRLCVSPDPLRHDRADLKDRRTRESISDTERTASL